MNHPMNDNITIVGDNTTLGSSGTTDDNNNNNNNDRIRILEEQILHLKIQLAIAKSTEDNLNLELSQVKGENKALKILLQIPPSGNGVVGDDSVEGRSAQEVARIGVHQEPHEDDDDSNILYNQRTEHHAEQYGEYIVPTMNDNNSHSRANNRPGRHLASSITSITPSCASGIALLSGQVTMNISEDGQEQQGTSYFDDFIVPTNNGSNSSNNRRARNNNALSNSITSRAPSCASGLALLSGIGGANGLTGNNVSWGSLASAASMTSGNSSSIRSGPPVSLALRRQTSCASAVALLHGGGALALGSSDSISGGGHRRNISNVSNSSSLLSMGSLAGLFMENIGENSSSRVSQNEEWDEEDLRATATALMATSTRNNRSMFEQFMRD